MTIVGVYATGLGSCRSQKKILGSSAQHRYLKSDGFEFRSHLLIQNLLVLNSV